MLRLCTRLLPLQRLQYLDLYSIFWKTGPKSVIMRVIFQVPSGVAAIFHLIITLLNCCQASTVPYLRKWPTGPVCVNKPSGGTAQRLICSIFSLALAADVLGSLTVLLGCVQHLSQGPIASPDSSCFIVLLPCLLVGFAVNQGTHSLFSAFRSGEDGAFGGCKENIWYFMLSVVFAYKKMLIWIPTSVQTKKF